MNIHGNRLEYKLCVLGAGGVGKSCLTIRLVSGQFLESYDPTIEDSYRKNLYIDDELAVCDIMDTAGQEEFESMQEQWMRWGSGFLLIYAINDRSTYDELSTLYNKLLRTKDEVAGKIPMVIVGNKCDMEKHREVSTEEGLSLAKTWAAPFLETSAKEEICVEEAFHLLVQEIRKIHGHDDENDNNNSGFLNFKFSLPKIKMNSLNDIKCNLI